QFGDVSRTEVSRFLHELPQDDLSWEIGQVKKSDEHKKQSAKAGVANLRDLFNKK
ncbi:MAG: ATP-dependent DNA helicase Rep, partial [Alteromonadaceae bacterium]